MFPVAFRSLWGRQRRHALRPLIEIRNPLGEGGARAGRRLDRLLWRKPDRRNT